MHQERQALFLIDLCQPQVVTFGDALQLYAEYRLLAICVHNSGTCHRTCQGRATARRWIGRMSISTTSRPGTQAISGFESEGDFRR